MALVRKWQIICYLITMLFLEQKLLTNDRTDLINEKINELAKTDEWLKRSWFGRVHIEELIQKHPDSDAFRKR